MAAGAMSREMDAIVTEYVEQAMFCSFWHMMRRMPAYAAIEAAGRDAIPALLRNLASDEWGGMSVMHALAATAGEWPDPELVADPVAPGWVGMRVDDARQAWLRWGRENGHIAA